VIYEAMSNSHWEHLPHGADIGVCGVGGSIAEAFEQAALALTAIVADPKSVAARELVDLACDAPDDELLLVEWLNAVIYEMATRKMLFGRFEVHIDGHKLTAKAWGEAINPERHELGVEVKGATCTNLKVAQEQSGQWRAQCVIDV
jgi:tRNA nucleotidyltransferase (CCA-adding enzyme)